MAYRLAEEHYNRRYGPAVQQHHSRYQLQAPAPAASNRYNSGGSSFQNNPLPSRGRGHRQERAPFPFPEPHNAHSSSYGSGFPVETPVLPPVPLFRDSRDHVGLGEDGNCWSGDRFHQESGILLSPPSTSPFFSHFFVVCVCVCVCVECYTCLYKELMSSLPTALWQMFKYR